MTKEHEKIIVYSSESTEKSLTKHFSDIWHELPQAHELGFRLFVRNIKSTYRQSLLGFGWALIPPFITSALWILLRSNGVMKTNVTGVSYPVFVLIGTLLWQIFSESILSPINAVNSNRTLISKINIPREGLILSGLYELVFNILIKMGVIAVALLLFKQSVSAGGLLLAPVGIAVTCLCGFSIGLALTPFGVLYQDIGRIISTILPFLMYLTPIVYATPSAGLMSRLMAFNPLATIISMTRNWLVNQAATDYLAFGIYTALFLALFFMSLVLYRLAMPMIIERMGS